MLSCDICANTENWINIFLSFFLIPTFDNLTQAIKCNILVLCIFKREKTKDGSCIFFFESIGLSCSLNNSTGLPRESVEWGIAMKQPVVYNLIFVIFNYFRFPTWNIINNINFYHLIGNSLGLVTVLVCPLWISRGAWRLVYFYPFATIIFEQTWNLSRPSRPAVV